MVIFNNIDRRCTLILYFFLLWLLLLLDGTEVHTYITLHKTHHVFYTSSITYFAFILHFPSLG